MTGYIFLQTFNISHTETVYTFCIQKLYKMCIKLMYRICIPHYHIFWRQLYILYTKSKELQLPAEFCIQNIYKSLSKCGIHFGYKHFVYLHFAVQLHFVYKMYTKVCQNVGYIFIQISLLKCGIHSYTNILYTYILYTLFLMYKKCTS